MELRAQVRNERSVQFLPCALYLCLEAWFGFLAGCVKLCCVPIIDQADFILTKDFYSFLLIVRVTIRHINECANTAIAVSEVHDAVVVLASWGWSLRR